MRFWVRFWVCVIGVFLLGSYVAAMTGCVFMGLYETSFLLLECG